MTRFRSSIVQTADPAAIRLRHTVRALLPEATGGAPRRRLHGRDSNPICRRCGWQHSRQVIDGACVDLGACAKREETWR